MDTQPLNLKIDSSQARADLAALAKALDTAGSASLRMEKSFTSSMAGVDRSLKGAMASMERYAKVATLVSNIKFGGDASRQLNDFAKALTALSRAKDIDKAKLEGVRKFIEIGAQASRLKMGAAGFVGLNMLSQAMDNAAKTRAIQSNKLTGWVNFIEVAARASQLRISPTLARNLAQFASSMEAIGKVRAITTSKVAALKNFFDVLGQAKPMPYAQSVAKDLDHLAASAARAGAAFATLPPRMRGLGPAMSTAATNGGKLNNVLHQTPGNANKAAGSFGKLNNELTRLGGRFSLTYQAGTLFTAMFSAFTVGQFIKGIYDTGTAMNKLNTAMFFATGTTDGAKTGTREYISMTQRLGLSLKDTADAYSRFTISATTSGVKLADSNKVFESVAGTLAVVGASTQQIELAFYGLTQMIMKGKVSSEEFNRQIGEQIPGNAEIGAQAMSKLEGRFVSVAEFFDKMRKGEILSKDFLVAYAQALKEEFGPLLESAMKRPDKALARLRNSFTLFQAEIGKNGFMVAVGEQFNRFADKIVDAEGNLTPTARKLAETFGRNLASMVRKAGDALVWLAENIDKVTFVAKALAGVLVIHTVTQWGSSIANSAKMLIDLASNAKLATGAILGLNAAQSANTATNAQAGVASAASTAGTVVGVPGGGKGKGPIPGSTGGIIAARGAKTIPTTTKMKGVAGIAQSGLNAVGLGGLIGRGTASAAAGASNVTKIMGLARMATLGWVGAILLVVSALAMLSDKETLVGGETVQFGDIMGGMFDDLGKKFGTWWKDATAGFTGWGAGLKDLQMSSGEVFATIVAGLQWVLEGVADVTMALVGSYDAWKKMKRGDYEGAQAAMGKIRESFADNDYGTMRENIVKNAQERSAKRGDLAGADAKAEAESKTAEEALARKRAEQEAMKLQSEKEGLARRIALGNQAELTWDDVIKRAQDAQKKSAEAQQSLATGAKDAGNSMIAAAQNVAQIAAGIQSGGMLAGNIAAPTSGTFTASAGAKPFEAQMTRIAQQNGINPETMKRLIQVESGWRPGVAGTGGDAVGLGQFTVGTWNDTMPGQKTSRNMGDADPRRDPALAMTATAKLMVKNNEAMKQVLGRDASAGEQYLAHFLGSGGARNLLAGMAANPNARVDQVRGITTSRGIANNPVFRGGQATLGEIYTWALDKFGETPAGVKTAGGVAARGAPGTGAMTAEEQEEAIKKGEDANQRWLRMARRGDPALEARANRDLQRSEIGELLGSQDKIMSMGLPSFIDPKDLVAVRDYIEKQAERGMNPFIEQREDSASRFESTSMRAKGLEDEATFRENINGLLKQGYTFTEQQLTAERSLFVMDQQRLRVLSAQSAAQDSMNKASLDQIRDGADPVFSNVMDRIDAIYEGGTLAEKKARALADGVYDIYSNIARAEIEAQASVEARDVTRGLANQRSQMSGSMASRTGESTRSLLGSMIPNGANKTLAELTSAASTLNVEVNGAKQNMLAFAEASVKAQEALERQAGALKVSRGLLDQARAAGMNNYDANRDASLRGTLEDLTGLSGLSMGELVAEASKLQVEIGGSSQGMLDFAQRVEKAKEELENRPGFERWVNGLDPLEKRLQDIKGDFMDGIGSGITDALMGEDVDWGQMAKELQKKVLRAHVDNVLAGIVNIATGKKPGEVALTPEAQATLDAARDITKAAGKTENSASNLTGSANNLNTAASALINAASALTNSGGGVGGSSGGLGNAVSAIASTVLGSPSATAAGTPAGTEGASWVGGLTGGVDGADYIARPSINGPLQLEAAPSLVAVMEPMKTGLDLNVPDLQQMPNPTFGAGSAGAPGAAGGLGGIFQSIGPSIAALITASMDKLPKNFESSSAFGNSLTLTPGETKSSKLAGFTSMLKSAMGSGAPAQGAQGAAQGGGLFSSIGGFVKNLFGGGGSLSGGTGSDTLAGGSGNDTLGGSFNAKSLMGTTGAMKALDNMMGKSAAGGGIMSKIGGFMGGGSAGAGGLGGMVSGMMGKMGGAEGMLGLGLPLIMSLFKKKKKPADILKPINGVIGEHRNVDVTGTSIAAHSNPIADVLNMALSQFTGGFGAGGGMSLGNTIGNMGKSMAGFFSEGGYSDTPVSRAAVSPINWSNVPHYSEGTPNTSGGMPAMLHPNEAVIPLSRGRSIPVELAGAGQPGPSNPVMNTNITVIAPNPDGFRKAAGSIQRQTNRDMKRASARNLT